MAEEGARKKRKRSAVACIGCHDRKVRCNVSWQGIPCSNCVEDGVSCDIYRKETHIPKRRHSNIEGHAHSISPSSTLTHSTAQNATPIFESGPENFPSNGQVQYPGNNRIGHERIDVANEAEYHPLQRSQQQYQPADVKHGVRPFYAGESEGLEFLFDVCCPDRTIRGLHYATPAVTYRAKRVHQRRSTPATLPAMSVQKELIHAFFLYLWPVLPVVDGKSFLSAFYSRDPSLSPLLLWSMFFAAASFVDNDILKLHGLGTRKQVKELYYQNAKNIYDAQDENDKTILIQSAILLASAWYMDLEDRDGMCHWLGVAITLSFTIGLHRRDNYDCIKPRPFPDSLRRLWKCLWWSIMYREAFTALGFGRPMRVDSEDCDVPIPSVHEVFGPSLDGIPDDIRSGLPHGTLEMAALWINLLELSLLLERVLKRHYRPRSIPASSAELEDEENAILSCRDRLLSLRTSDSPVLAIHAAHLKTYYNSVLIALYRPYMHRHLKDQYEDIALKAKRAAASTTSVLNELISRNAVEVGPSMLVTGMMSALQIYVWEVQYSTGLARSYAYHHLDLYLMVMSHLGRTYWTADLQHNLFVEALKVIKGAFSTLGSELRGVSQAKGHGMDLPSVGTLDHAHSDNLIHGSLDDDFFLSFNPFMGLPMQPDDLSASIDLGLSPAGLEHA